MRYKLILVSFLFFVLSCSPFSNLSKKTYLGNERGYQSVYNSDAKFNSLTFGDFKFAFNNKEYKKLKKQNTKIKDILFYARTTDPAYEYFILLNPENKKFDAVKYYIKDTIINNNNFVLLVSNDAPERDIKFISENIFEYEKIKKLQIT